MVRQITTRLEGLMKPQSHIVDLLSAAKILAETQNNALLSYIINMAMIEASTGGVSRKNAEDRSGVEAA